VIDAKAETGRQPAAAYCNRGQSLPKSANSPRALADYTRQSESIRYALLSPTTACRVYASSATSSAGAIADYYETIRIDPSFCARLYNRGDACRDGRYRSPFADFNTAIKLNRLAIAYASRVGSITPTRHANAIRLQHADQAFARRACLYHPAGNAYRDSERSTAPVRRLCQVSSCRRTHWAAHRCMIQLYKGDNKRAGR